MDLAARDKEVSELRNVKKGLTNDLISLQPNAATNENLSHATNNLINYLNMHRGGSSDTKTHLSQKINFAINDIYMTLGTKI